MDGNGSKRWTLHAASYAVGFLTASLAGLGGLTLLNACRMAPSATYRTSCSVLGLQLDALGDATADSARSKGELPPSLEALVTPVDAGHAYLKAVPDDLWGRAYLYELQPDGGARIASRSEDGLAHTGDDNAFVIERGPTWVVREATSAEVQAAGR